jgi:hypothetical protein
MPTPMDLSQITTLFGERRSRRRVVGATTAGLAAAGFSLAASGSPRDGTAAVVSDGTPSVSGATPPAARQPDDPSFLFVQSFRSGTLAPADGEAGRYTLTLGEGLGQTIAFSDRPERIVSAVATSDWLGTFPFGDANPPNAALVTQTSDADTDVLVMELRRPRYDPDSRTATYDAQLLRDYERLGVTFQQEPGDGSAVPASFGAASLFIDDCPDFTYCYSGEEETGENYIGPLPGGDEPSCWQWDGLDTGCSPCHTSWDALEAQCDAAYSGCLGNCRIG